MFDKRSGHSAPAPQGAFEESAFTVQTTADQGVEQEYRELLCNRLSRLGIPKGTVEIQIQVVGGSPDGRSVYIGLLRLAKWEPRRSVRMLLALPLLEAKARKALEGTWLGEVSIFGGLWLHAASPVRSPAVLSEIHQVIVRLETDAGRDGSRVPGTPMEVDRARVPSAVTAR
ncbi:hypothetical protein [Ramlibacter humi]|nr:hypothetical protein [Ramlibacter humi]